MANVKLPERFRLKLENDQHLEGVVKTTLSDFGDLLTENKLFFFGEYTDHGINHITNILTSTDALIPDLTFETILASNDIGYYILSVVLHDIGMHLDFDGFKQLISGAFDDIIVSSIDKQSWRELWDDYLNEASKFSGHTLKSIFGDDKTIIVPPDMENKGALSENQKKLIGEFIRRNHPRLAHEIALKGFPGADTNLPFAKNLDVKVRNLIGLIARSHGIALRKSIDYIEDFYGFQMRRVQHNCHATYLMILLRISDYIQIDNTRTSKTLLKLRAFSSPVSEIEHYSHLAIDEIDMRYNDDSERIFVIASPEDSKMFLKIKKLIQNIQYELDISWAVLGELYSDKKKTEIRYRRISSNLEDESFQSKLSYVADTFAFRSNDEIIKLLISPLYGGDPKYGVRELLQNAVDACLERQFIENRFGEKQYNPLIEIHLYEENGYHFFSISDNGIGMDSEVIRKYFLTVGASYRKSFDWQKQFVDKQKNSVVRRSGRFGVGVLAAFLLGDEIDVETRSISGSSGFYFKADLNSEQINIIKTNRTEYGTTIKIKLNNQSVQDAKTKLTSHSYFFDSWIHWYTLASPAVKYYKGNTPVNPNNSGPRWFPEKNTTIPIGWNSLECSGFEKILWSYDRNYSFAKLTCNGFLIPSSGIGLSPKILTNGLFTNAPTISVFDNNALLPLALDRKSLTAELPFDTELIEDIYKDFIAYILAFKCNFYVGEDKVMPWDHRFCYPGLKSCTEHDLFLRYGPERYKQSKIPRVGNFYNQIDSCFSSEKGFIVDYNFFLRKLGPIDTIFFISKNPQHLKEIEISTKNKFFKFSITRFEGKKHLKMAVLPEYNDANTTHPTTSDVRFFMSPSIYNALFVKEKIDLKNTFTRSEKYSTDNWICMERGKLKESIFSQAFFEQSHDVSLIRECAIECPYEGDVLLNSLLERYFGNDVIIPYDVEERKKKYPLAFHELAHYMFKYLNPEIY